MDSTMTVNSRPAAQGWTWIAEGWALFQRAPWPWVLVALVFALVFIGMNFVPVLGPLAGMVLSPVFAGGLMLGCRQLQEGGELQVGHLFAGFRAPHLGTLAAVGGIYLGASIVIALVVGLATGGTLFSVMGGGEMDPAAALAASMTILLALLAMLALMVPVFMALWFAPPLVVFQNKGALEAMRLSFFAGLKNMLPFLLYGLILLGLSIVASIPAGLGWLVLGPVVAASVYTGYRDIFPS